jgi:hypothetical protein
MNRYNEALTRAGVLLALDGLHPAEKGARVRATGGRKTVTDGPCAVPVFRRRRLARRRPGDAVLNSAWYFGDELAADEAGTASILGYGAFTKSLWVSERAPGEGRFWTPPAPGLGIDDRIFATTAASYPLALSAHGDRALVSNASR